MEGKSQEAMKDFDYSRAGKFQVVIAFLAYMHGGYWLNVGRPAAVRAERVPVEFITAFDWFVVGMMVLAVLPLLRGIYLIRKGRSLGQG